jgi:hypothetical protein
MTYNRDERNFMMATFRNFGGGNQPQGDGDGIVQGPLAGMIGFNAGDVADDLPPHAAVRLRAMREEAAELTVLAQSNFSEVQQLQNEKRESEIRLRRLQQARSDGGFNLDAGDLRVLAEQKKLDKIVAELVRKKEVGEIRGAKNHTLMRLAASCAEWARSGRPGGTRIVAFDGKLPELKQGADILVAIEDRRRRLRELAAERHRVECAPHLSATAKAKYGAEIAALAEIGRLDVGGLIEHNANEIVWPRKQHQVTIYNSDQPLIGFIELDDFRALLAQLVPESLLKALDRECADVADDAAALTDTARAKALATISADFLACERAESELVWIAQSRGMAVSHREDCDVRALLGLDLVIAKAPPASDSGEHTTTWVGAPR